MLIRIFLFDGEFLGGVFEFHRGRPLALQGKSRGVFAITPSARMPCCDTAFADKTAGKRVTETVGEPNLNFVWTICFSKASACVMASIDISCLKENVTRD
jgi:hypothetical protein